MGPRSQLRPFLHDIFKVDEAHHRDHLLDHAYLISVLLHTPMTHSLVHRLQKWLLEEPFQIDYNPKSSPPFSVTIKGRPSDLVIGFEGKGFSISQAAKIAIGSREAFYADSTLEQIPDARTCAGANT